MGYRHIPVMCAEVLEHLNCRPGKIYVDGTLGGAGHARAICDRIRPDGLLIGMDQDADAVASAQEILAPCAGRVKLFRENFAHMGDVLSRLELTGVDGILLDLGISLNQLERSGRGFSFQRNEPLDMRMDVRLMQTAADLVNRLKEAELRRLFEEYGEERWAGRIARRIVQTRRRQPLGTSGDLARLICEAAPGGWRGRARIHPATRVFMALRIAVNRELERLEEFFDRLPGILNHGGRLCIVSFHSLEDRIVKQRMKALAEKRSSDPYSNGSRSGTVGILKILTKKVVRPGPAEVAANPMARSAKLRTAERV